MGVRTDIPKIMKAMDIFLLPSLHERLQIVTLTGVTLETIITGNVTFIKVVKGEENAYNTKNFIRLHGGICFI